jgi:hypothetical protein
MEITWDPTWSRWVGVACAMFGFANIVGALAGPPELWFPGVVIGSIWAAVGVKRGLPLFASAPRAVASPGERITRGLQNIRRRKRLALFSPLVWLPIAAVILPQVPEKLLATVFLLTALPLGAVVTIWTLSACPRCGGYFLPVLRPRFFISLSRCDKCGLGFHDASRVGLTTDWSGRR